ncbi:ABC transporter substrate-binding protein [Maritalea myrionectae]|uniref:ABC transporter substrate-binding protein n=1 Tax=Maritalea myrionectae TaxID=454601 RepID=UPI000403EB16|nr:extracellular solute-binding protein [Maritalea myrionectae]
MRAILFMIALLAAVLGALSSGYAQAQQQQLRILTSMSARVFEPFVKAFEAQNPNIDVLVLNKNTNHALGEVALGNGRKFDIFWASSPEAFDMLDDFDHLAPMDGKVHHAFALSAVGWSWKKDHLAKVPQSWNALLERKYEGRIGIARPSRSGTTHLIVEQFLQDRGWEDGWQYVLQLSANFATITSRSFGVIDGLKSERFDIGLNIDFLAISEDDLAFQYGRPVMLVPGRIAKLKGSGAPELADQFINFVLSKTGQQILLTPKINRIPIEPEIRQSIDYRAYPSLDAALRLSWASYDPKLAARRYWMVNEIFDQFITNQFGRRRAIWRDLRLIEDDPELAKKHRAKLDLARTYLLTMPIAEHEVAIMQPSPMPGPGMRYAPMTAEQKKFQVRWQSQAEMLLGLAENELREIKE